MLRQRGTAQVVDERMQRARCGVCRQRCQRREQGGLQLAMLQDWRVLDDPMQEACRSRADHHGDAATHGLVAQPFSKPRKRGFAARPVDGQTEQSDQKGAGRCGWPDLQHRQIGEEMRGRHELDALELISVDGLGQLGRQVLWPEMTEQLCYSDPFSIIEPRCHADQRRHDARGHCGGAA